MAVYFAVFNKQVEQRMEPEKTWGSVKLLPAGEVATGHLESAKIVKLEAATLAEAQRGIQHFFPGMNTSTPIIVTEAQWKET